MHIHNAPAIYILDFDEFESRSKGGPRLRFSRLVGTLLEAKEQGHPLSRLFAD